MKFCKDCKHFSVGKYMAPSWVAPYKIEEYDYDACNYHLDVVTGEVAPTWCREERKDDLMRATTCGSAAQFWEAK